MSGRQGPYKSDFNSTNYVHPKDENLNNLHKAMAYDAAGEPHVRVTLGSDTITISGNVNVGTDVSINNTSENPVPVTITNTELEIKNDVNNPVPISATTSINTSNNPIFTSANITGGNIDAVVSGTITVSSITNTANVNVVNTPNVNVTGGTISTTEGLPFNVQVALGKIPGYTGLSISGYCSSVGTEFVPLWDSAVDYVYFPTAQVVRVWSSSASDTNVSVTVAGLDSNYLPITETVVLNNGATGVLTTNQFLRVNSAALTRIPMNVGIISVGASNKAITLTTIEAGAGRSQMTIYTVPAGYTFYLTQGNWYTNQTGSQTALFRSWTRTATGVINVVLTFPFVQIYHSLKVVPRAYGEKTDIQWQAASSSGSSRIGGQIEGYLIQNSVI